MRHGQLTTNLADLAFADDNLLLGVSAKHLEEFLAQISSAGGRYRLQLHFGKLTHLLGVKCSSAIRAPNGSDIAADSEIDYLGTMLAADSTFESLEAFKSEQGSNILSF